MTLLSDFLFGVVYPAMEDMFTCSTIPAFSLFVFVICLLLACSGSTRNCGHYEANILLLLFFLLGYTRTST